MAGYAATEEELPRFAELGALSAAGKEAMASFGYATMTAVQHRSFGAVVAGKELLARAKTGSGKTLSFLLPAVERMQRMDGVRPGSVVMLVLTPVRELSMQVAKEAEKLLSFYSSCRMVCMTGGVPWEEDLRSLDEGEGAVVLIATPGRLQSHVAKTEGFAERLCGVKVLVLDEVDQLATDVFQGATLEIVGALPPASERQGLFYSATLSDAVHGLVRDIGRADYTFVDVISEDAPEVPEHIEQRYCVAPTERLTECLWRFAQEDFKAVAIFMTGRIAAYYADAFRRSCELPVFEIHARRSQKQRTEESERFRSAERGLLFTSDVSSRGLDYPGVTHVLQMGAPRSRAEYIHRLGRTGRAGAEGQGLLLLHDFERGFLQELADLEIKEEVLPEAPPQDMPDFPAMPIAKNVKDHSYYSRINHVMRNSQQDLLEIMREAHRFARSIGAVDQEGRPPAITLDNATKMGVAELEDFSVNISK